MLKHIFFKDPSASNKGDHGVGIGHAPTHNKGLCAGCDTKPGVYKCTACGDAEEPLLLCGEDACYNEVHNRVTAKTHHKAIVPVDEGDSQPGAVHETADRPELHSGKGLAKQCLEPVMEQLLEDLKTGLQKLEKEQQLAKKSQALLGAHQLALDEGATVGQAKAYFQTLRQAVDDAEASAISLIHSAIGLKTALAEDQKRALVKYASDSDVLATRIKAVLSHPDQVALLEANNLRDRLRSSHNWPIPTVCPNIELSASLDPSAIRSALHVSATACFRGGSCQAKYLSCLRCQKDGCPVCLKCAVCEDHHCKGCACLFKIDEETLPEHVEVVDGVAEMRGGSITPLAKWGKVQPKRPLQAGVYKWKVKIIEGGPEGHVLAAGIGCEKATMDDGLLWAMDKRGELHGHWTCHVLHFNTGSILEFEVDKLRRTMTICNGHKRVTGHIPGLNQCTVYPVIAMSHPGQKVAFC